MDDLYRRGGDYEYSQRLSTPVRSSSLAAGIAVALIGLAVPSLRWLYDYAWFVGFAVSAAVYIAADARAAQLQFMQQ